MFEPNATFGRREKSIKDQLKIDQEEISKIDYHCEEVIPAGYGMYKDIQKKMIWPPLWKFLISFLLNY